jgi:hypothetical protein
MENNSSTSNFKRFILRFALPVLIALSVIFYALNWLVETELIYKYDSSGGYKVHRLLYENDLNEIPIFGSSRANGSYIPSLIDSNAYNYGLEKTEIDFLLLCLEEELTKKRVTPIIINFDYGLFASKKGDLAHFVPSASHSKVQAYLDTLYSFKMQIPLMKYFGHFDTYLKTFKAEKDAFHCLNRGCFILKDPSTEDFIKSLKLRSKTKSVFKIDTNKNQQLVDLFIQSSRKIYLVVAPYHKSFFDSYNNLEIAKEYLNSIDAIKSVQVINLGSMNLSNDNFLNTGHVNYEGAVKFSDTLRTIINRPN